MAVKRSPLLMSAVMMIIPMVIFFVLGELAVRIYTQHHIFYDIEMSRYALELKSVSPNPSIGHVHKPDSHANLMGVVVEINSDGLRDDEYSVERGDSHRIIFLGDSLTFGWGVEKEFSFETILEREMSRRRPTEILNLGTGNYNTQQEVHLFLEKGLKYEPDKVVLFYFINDAEDTPSRSAWAFLGHSRFVTFFWSRFHAARANLLGVESFEEYYSNLYREDQPGWANAQESLRLLKEVCLERGIALQVVLLPELHAFSPYPLESEHREIMASLDAIGIDGLDLAPFFQGETEPQRLWVAVDDAHPNADAHELIAKYTLPFLTQ